MIYNLEYQSVCTTSCTCEVELQHIKRMQHQSQIIAKTSLAASDTDKRDVPPGLGRIRRGVQLYHRELTKSKVVSVKDWADVKQRFDNLSAELQKNYEDRVQYMMAEARHEQNELRADIEKQSNVTVAGNPGSHIQLQPQSVPCASSGFEMAIVPATANVGDDALPLKAQPHDLNVSLNSQYDFARTCSLPGLDSIAAPLSITPGMDDIEPISSNLIKRIYERQAPFHELQHVSYSAAKDALKNRCNTVELSHAMPDIVVGETCSYMCHNDSDDDDLRMFNYFVEHLNTLCKHYSISTKAADIGGADLLIAWEQINNEGDIENRMFTCIPVALGRWYRFDAKMKVAMLKPSMRLQEMCLFLPRLATRDPRYGTKKTYHML